MIYGMNPRLATVSTLVLLLVTLSAAGSAEAAEGSSPKKSRRGLDIRGSFFADYRGRFSNVGQEDHRQQVGARLDLGRSGVDRVTAGFFGVLLFDYDGGLPTPVPAGDDLFFDLGNTYSNSFRTRIYRANVDIDRLGPLRRLRLGRQYIEGLLPLHLDGFSAKTRRFGPFRGEFFAGVPVDFYENSYDGEWIAGGSGGFDLTPATRLGLQLFGRREVDTRFGDSTQLHTAVSLRQRLGRTGEVSLRNTTLKDREKDITARLRFRHEPWGLAGRAEYYVLVSEMDDRASEFGGLSGVLGSWKPYQRFLVQVDKQFGESIGFYGGLFVRRPLFGRDEGAYNRDYDRVYWGMAVDGFPPRTKVNILLDLWYAEPRRSFTFGGDLSVDAATWLDLEAGTFFNRFIEDYGADLRDTDARIYFAQAKIRRGALMLRGRYEMEDSTGIYFHKVGVRAEVLFR